MNKSNIIFISTCLFIAFLFLMIGINIGKQASTNQSFFSLIVPIPTNTATITVTPTPTITKTPKPTRTPRPTITPTPTLAPGEFPYSAKEVRDNLYNDVELKCMAPAKSDYGGYFWDCKGRDGYNVLRAIFYGKEENRIDFIIAYALNTYSPSPYQVTNLFGILLRNVLLPGDGEYVTSQISAALYDLSGLGDEIIEDNIKGFPITLTGPGICRVLFIGNDPPQIIDRELIPVLSEIEAMCNYSPLQ